MRRRLPIVPFIAITLLGAIRPAQAQVDVVPQQSGVDASLRGISAVDANVAWASGAKGTVLRTIDGGAHWQAVNVPGAAALDFRDVEAFDAQTAVVLSIGDGASSQVYRTQDGGRHWTRVLANRDPQGFFDCMVFDGTHGWLLGDPVDGHFQVYATTDQGRRWTLQPHGPAVTGKESAFAASGTCIAGNRHVQLVASGGEHSHLFMARAGTPGWQAVDSGMSRQLDSAGVFALAALPDGSWLAGGGDYRKPDAPGSAAHVTLDPKRGTPRVQPLPPPPGHISGLACVATANGPCIAVSENRSFQWHEGRWSPLSPQGYLAVDLAGHTGWASGAGGRIARIVVRDSR